MNYWRHAYGGAGGHERIDWLALFSIFWFSQCFRRNSRRPARRTLWNFTGGRRRHPKQFNWPQTCVLVTRFLSAIGVGEVTDFMEVDQASYGNQHHGRRNHQPCHIRRLCTTLFPELNMAGGRNSGTGPKTKADSSSPDKLRFLPNKESATFLNSKWAGGYSTHITVKNYYLYLFSIYKADSTSSIGSRRHDVQSIILSWQWENTWSRWLFIRRVLLYCEKRYFNFIATVTLTLKNRCKLIDKKKFCRLRLGPGSFRRFRAGARHTFPDLCRAGFGR